jgi:hypothetical protein
MEKEAIQSLPVAGSTAVVPTFSLFVGAVTNTVTNSQELYIIGTDGNLWRYLFTTSSWTNIGTPPGVTIDTYPYPTVVFSGTGNAYVILMGSDTNIWHWCADPTGGWENLGGSTKFTGGALIGAVNVRDGNVYVYYTGISNNKMELWLCNWAGSAGWQWTDLGVPAELTTTLTGWGTAMLDSGGNPYALVIEHSGNLWMNFFTAQGWLWNPATALPSGVAAMFSAGSVDLNGIGNAFFFDSMESNLWCSYRNSISEFQWANLGRPANNHLIGGNMATMQGSDGNAYVFFLNTDSNMWCWVGQNGVGAWQNMYKPAGATLVTDKTYAAATQGPVKPNLFAADTNGKIWMASWDAASSNWAWSPLPAAN